MAIMEIGFQVVIGKAACQAVPSLGKAAHTEALQGSVGHLHTLNPRRQPPVCLAGPRAALFSADGARARWPGGSLDGLSRPFPCSQLPEQNSRGKSKNDLLGLFSSALGTGAWLLSRAPVPTRRCRPPLRPRQSRPSPVVWQVPWPGGLSGGGDWGLCLHREAR